MRFYTLCPKHPECGCKNASQCSNANPHTVIRALRLLSAALLPVVTVGATLSAIAIAFTPTCAHAGDCGGCSINGSSGFVAWKGKVQHCIPCHSVKPEQLIAWQPPVEGGPRKTRGSGTRNS